MNGNDLAIGLSALNFLKKAYNSTHTSEEVRIAKEEYTLATFLRLYPYWEIEEYPITSIKQSQLQSGDCIPDAIIKNKLTGERCWIEFTSASRSREDHKEIGLRQKGSKNSHNLLSKVVNLGYACGSLNERINNILVQKNNKKYEAFSRLANLENDGILVILLELQDVFHDFNEHFTVVDNFKNKHVLTRLGTGESDFKKIFLLSFVQQKDNSWKQVLTLIMDEEMKEILKNHSETKARILKEISERQLA